MPISRSVRVALSLGVFVISLLRRFRFAVVPSIALLALAYPSAAVHADVVGFNDLSGWTYNQSDAGTPADLPSPNTIHLTNLSTGQARSIFNNTPQPVDQFVASFTYRAQNASVFGCDYGATFTLHDSPVGASALGSSGGGMGYVGIASSAAVTFELQNNASGYFTNGSIGGNGITVGPLSLTSGRPFDVVLTYDGTLLREAITDTVSLATHNKTFIVGSLSSLLGSDTAYVGFTASTTQGACSGNAADQYFSNFHFATVPEPATLALFGAVGLFVLRRRRRSPA